MKQTVNIRKEYNQIKVHFVYNEDLYDIMKNHNGWFSKREKCWVFPLDKLGEIKKDIKSKHHIVKEIVEKINFDNPFDEPGVIAVYGHCKKCSTYCSIDRNGFCFQCLLKK